MKKSLISCAILGLALSGCGGGGGGSSATNSDGEILSSVTTGFVLPTEISAVPADSSSTTGIQINSFASVIQALTVDQLPAASDYKKASARRYIEERELEQFDVIEQVMSAVAQTNYADPANINARPYKAMIAWEDEQDGREVKTLEPWVVESRMIVVDGQDVNRLLAWIEEPDFDNPGQIRLIKAEFKIYTSANVNADGSFADYGEWDMNVSFNDDGSRYFAATSRIANGVNTIKIHENGAGEFNAETKGILVRSGTSGSGKVNYPDGDACYQTEGPPDFDTCITMKTAQYAYNTDYIVVDGDISTPGDEVYKDRDPDNAAEMTHQYGLFYADADAANDIAAGDSLQKHKQFGFPLVFTNADFNYEEHAYYGAWQGRHEIWNGQDLEAGDVVTKENHNPDATPQTYVVSDKFNGILTKRSLVDANLDDIKNIPVETWVNKHYDLFYDGVTDNEWKSCAGWMDWSGPTCRSFADDTDIGFSTFSNFSSLVVGEGDRKWVNVGSWDSIKQQPINYVYLASDPSIQGFTFAGAGFYEADFDQMTGGQTPKVPAALLTPTDGDNMWIDIGGSIYIMYTGNFTSPNTGWVQKTLESFNEQTWTPVFSSTGDTTFSPELGREYYINNNGANFVVKRRDAADEAASYEAKIELQTAANPINYSTILPTGTSYSYLATPWRPEVEYTFVTDANDANFMKLVYLTDDPNTQDVDESSTPTVATAGEWGLQAYNSSDLPLKADGTVVAVDEYGIPTDPAVRPVEFNWEYSEGGEGWGVQQFLCTPDCSSTDNYVMLSDPVQLEPITVPNGAGVDKTLSLMYDGWMHGLPDMYQELSKNDWQMSSDISDKIINIPAGTAVTDSSDDTTMYYVKPLEVSVFLGVVDGTTTPGVPDISDADAVDLSTVPDFTDHGMGAKPTGTVVKYSEGIAVE